VGMRVRVCVYACVYECMYLCVCVCVCVCVRVRAHVRALPLLYMELQSHSSFAPARAYVMVLCLCIHVMLRETIMSTKPFRFIIYDCTLGDSLRTVHL